MTQTVKRTEPALAVRRTFDGEAPISAHTAVRIGGRVVVEASTQLLPTADGDTLNIHIGCVAGHQPPWARRLLVHDLLDRAEHAGLHRVLMVVPLGDSEILDALREHCDHVSIRAAGSTCIVEAEIRCSTRQDRAS